MNTQKSYQNHQIIRRICSCGYDPRADKTKHTKRECTETQALWDHYTFPSFNMINTSEFYGRILYPQLQEPDRHCAMLVELVAPADTCTGPFNRHSWCSHNQYGELFWIHFYLDHTEEEKPTTFSCKDIVRGNTVAILSPEKADRCITINFTNFEVCTIFKSPLRHLYTEADKLLKDATRVERGETNPNCFVCGLEIVKDINTCTGCKLAKYCSKVCLDKHVKSHKSICSQSETLLRLSLLPRHSFDKDKDEHFTFHRDQESSPRNLDPLPPASDVINANQIPKRYIIRISSNPGCCPPVGVDCGAPTATADTTYSACTTCTASVRCRSRRTCRHRCLVGHRTRRLTHHATHGACARVWSPVCLTA